MKAEIVIATSDHIAEIGKKVRPADREELWAASLSTPENVMKRGLEYSDKAYTGMIGGEPVCMWGVAPVDLLFGLGAPWMVGTSDLDEHATKFLRRCRKHLLELFEGYDKLENYVDARNVKAIRWLKFMGFAVDDKTQPYGALKMPFHRFWKEAIACVTPL